ncbi:MAG: PQQ-binding-like beta-propeller repeat protein [Pirellulales bacterium]
MRIRNLLLVCLIVSSASASAQEWTRFRGPNGTGESEATTIPLSWNEQGFLWRVALPGKGNSSPVLWGDKLFITSGDSETARRYLQCLSATDGHELWRHDSAGTAHHLHVRNTFASSTPTVDAERVYVVWGAPESLLVQAFDHAGKPVWSTDLGPHPSQHGYGGSPMIYEDLLIVGNDQDGVSALVALDRRTGEKRWSTPRKSREAAYSVPCVRKLPSGGDELVFNSGAHGITGVNPRTGSVNWELDVFDKRSVSSPLVVNGLVFGSCGSGAGGNYVVAIDPVDAAGERPEIAWKFDRSAPYVPTPVAYGPLLFLWSDQGVVTCVRAASGERVWQKRIGGNFSGSPVRVADRIYCSSDEGEMYVLAAAEEYALLAKNPMGEPGRSTPAVAGGRMFLRTESHLAALGEGKAP